MSKRRLECIYLHNLEAAFTAGSWQSFRELRANTPAAHGALIAFNEGIDALLLQGVRLSDAEPELRRLVALLRPHFPEFRT